MNQAYKKFVDAIDQLAEAITEINDLKEHKAIKLLVVQFVGKSGLGNPELGDLLAMIKFAVDNDDPDLHKLTEEITNETNEAVS